MEPDTGRKGENQVLMAASGGRNCGWGQETPFSLCTFLSCVQITILKKFNLFIFIFLAALCLHCCMRAFSSCGEQGLLFIVVCGLLIAVASLVAEHGL